MWRFNIFAKGLVLVCVPLACSLGLVGTLLYLNAQEEQQLREVQHAGQLYYGMDRFAKYVMLAAYDVCEFRNAQLMVERDTILARRMEPKVEEYRNSYLNSLRQCDDALERGQKLVRESNDPLEVDSMQRIQSSYMLAREMIQQATQSEDPMGTVFPLKYFLRNDHPFKSMRQLADVIVAQETLKVKRHEKSVESIRTTIQTLLAVSVLLIILLAFALTYLLSRQVTDRLKVLMDNTVRMSKRQQLNPVLGGVDEIAELDRVLHRTAGDLAELEKFKRELTGMVTHELRTPLTSIYGVLGLMRAGALGELPAAAKEKAAVAESNAKRLLSLINDLLDIERMEAGHLDLHMAPTQLDALIAQAVTAVGDFASQKQIEIKVSGCNLWVMADADRLAQVIINLVSNGVKYSNGGTTITISAVKEGSVARVNVSDQGRGIPDEHKARIFERFQQVRKDDAADRKSSGLGLAICKALIEQHGGTINVESVVGQGSTFSFTVPLAPEVPAPSETPASVASQ